MSKNHTYSHGPLGIDYTVLTPKKAVVLLIFVALIILGYTTVTKANNKQSGIEGIIKPIKEFFALPKSNLPKKPEVPSVIILLSPTPIQSSTPTPTLLPTKSLPPKKSFITPSPTPFPTWQTKSYEELRREQDEWFRKVQEENRRKSEESKKALEQFRQESQQRFEEFKKQAEEGFSLPKLD